MMDGYHLLAGRLLPMPDAGSAGITPKWVGTPPGGPITIRHKRPDPAKAPAMAAPPEGPVIA